MSVLFDEEAVGRVAAAPDDAKTYLVLADALEDAGDPRGKWGSLLHEAERGSGDDFARLTVLERKYFAKHRKRLVGLPESVARELEIEWRWGFMHRAAATSSTVRTLLAAPAAQFLRSLTIEPGDVEAVAESAPRLLGSLTVGPLDERAETLRTLKLGDVGALWTLPLLRSLTLQGARFSISRELPRLRHLRLGLVNEGVLTTVAAMRWPEVESLELRLDWPVQPTKQLQQLKRFFEATWLPKLRSLTVSHCTASNEVVGVLAKSRVAEALTTLDLSLGTLTEAGLRTVVAAFPSLTALVVDRNHLAATARAPRALPLCSANGAAGDPARGGREGRPSTRRVGD